MSVDTKHPLFAARVDDWTQLRHCYVGQREVKSHGFLYLPATSGMIEDGALTSTTSKGWLAYDAYRRRARFPDITKEAVKALLGTMHNKPPVIELPSALETMRDRATVRGESLEMLLQRLNEEQLITGRSGLLADLIDEGVRRGEFYIAMYKAEHVINWDEGDRDDIEVQNLNLVVLDESSDERVDVFEWETMRKYRVLVLGDPLVNEPEGSATYRVGVFKDTDSFNEAALIEPRVRGRVANELPFVFVNSQDIVPEPDIPPLLGLSDLALTIYRGEADYRQALFLQGQDTLVTIGGGEEDGIPRRIGAGAEINIPSTDGDAKFIGVDSTGLSEQRMALENDYKQGREISGSLMDANSREKESGDALRVRVAVRTATLNRVAIAGAFGLETLLRKVAIWRGANPEEVIVTPNLDFTDDEMTGEEIAQFMGAKMLGAPISMQTIHKIMADRGVTEQTFEDELKLIEEEEALAITERNKEAGKRPGPDDPDDDEEEDETEEEETEEEETEPASASA